VSPPIPIDATVPESQAVPPSGCDPASAGPTKRPGRASGAEQRPTRRDGWLHSQVRQQGNRSSHGVGMRQPGGATNGRCIARLPCQTRFGRRPLRGESGVRTKGAGRLAMTSLKVFCKPGLCSALRTGGSCDAKRPAGRRLVNESCTGTPSRASRRFDLAVTRVTEDGWTVQCRPGPSSS
jgi:hypothetical protein